MHSHNNTATLTGDDGYLLLYKDYKIENYIIVNMGIHTDELDSRSNLPCALLCKVVICFFTCAYKNEYKLVSNQLSKYIPLDFLAHGKIE